MAYGKSKDPQEDIIKLNRVIKEQTFSNVHLLYGPEDYLRYQLRDNLVSAMGGVPGSLSYSRFTGKDVSAEEIIGLADTMPFMSDRRVILIEDTGWFKEGNEEIEEYIESGVSPDTCIVFCEKDVDARKRLFGLVKKNGMVSEFMTQSENTLITWIRTRLKNSDISISSSDASYLISVAGTDMENLAVETEKLISYCLLKKTVTAADIDAICSRSVEDRVFDMCEDMANGRIKSALRKYYDLVTLKESTTKIIILVIRHFNTLLQIKDLLMRKKYSEKEIAAKVGKNDWAVKKFLIPQANKYTRNELVDIVGLFTDLFSSMTNGQISADIVMEVGFAEFSRMTRRRA